MHVYAHSYVKCNVKDLAREVSTQWGTLAQLHIYSDKHLHNMSVSEAPISV